MIIVASLLALLVIVAGMFLLAKTQKEGLSNMFKYVSYFVIGCGFFSLFAGGTIFIISRCMMHMQKQHEMNEEKNFEHCSHWKHHGESCEREEGEEEGGNCIRKEIIIRDGEEMNGESCEGKEGMKGEKECCKKMMMKKDSVVIKK
jgi:hypothetical protein